MVQLIIRAIMWAGLGYMGNDVVDAVKESKQSDVNATVALQEKLSKFQDKEFLGKLAIMASGIFAGMVFFMPKTKRKRILKF